MSGAHHGTFRPICIASVAARFELFGWNSDAHHAMLLALHGITTALAYAVGRRWELSQPRALFAAAFFGFAPLRLDAAMTLHASCDILLVPALLAIAWLIRGDHLRPPRLAALALLALGACWTKETGYIAVAGLMLATGWKARRKEALVLAGTLAVALAVRTAALSEVLGSYARHQLGAGVGWRGPVETALLSLVPFPELQGAGVRLSRALPASYSNVRNALLVGGALATILAAARLRATAPRRLALALGVAGLVGTLGQVGSRTAYLVGLAVAFGLATARLPNRDVTGIAAIAIVSGLVASFAARLETQREAGQLARSLRREALVQAEGSDVIVLLAAPVRLAAAHSEPASECFERTEPAHARVVLELEGTSLAGGGPSVHHAADGRVIIRPSADFQFGRTHSRCVTGEFALAGRPASLRCDGDRPIEIAIAPATRDSPPLLVWRGSHAPLLVVR